MKRSLKRIAWIIAAAAVAVLIVQALRTGPIVVQTAQAAYTPLAVELAAEGRTRAPEHFVVSSPITGHLQRVGLREGDAVRKGETIAELEPVELAPQERDELGRRIDAAAALYESARDVAERAGAVALGARRDAARVRAIAESGAASRQDLEHAESLERQTELEYRATQHRVSVAEAELAALRTLQAARPGALRRNRTRLVAPVDGVVLSVAQRSERPVVAGSPIATLIQRASLEVVADLLTSDAVKVRPGQSVVIDGWGGGYELGGRVLRVEPAGFTKISALGIEEQRVNVVIEVPVAPPELGDGFRTNVRIVVAAPRNVLSVPLNALFRTGERWTVFVVRDGTAVLVPVTLGRRSRFAVEITSGLAGGDHVVTHPSDLLENGANVEIQAPS